MRQRMLRKLTTLVFGLGIAFLSNVVLSGCGGGIKEGIPDDVDMTKDYSPQVEMPGMDRKKATADPFRPTP